MKIKNLALIVLAALAAGNVVTAAETDTNQPATNAPAASTNTAPSVVSVPSAAPATNAPEIAEISDAAAITPTNEVRMNFHDVPLKTVLNYLSARMGFVVVSDTEVRGNATIVSAQPVGTNEVIELLSGALAKNSYSVSRNGRVLTIATAENAKTESPVKQADKPADVPINDEIATYILPVHTLPPVQLIKDLDQLIPPGATVAANEAGNAVIMTARQRDIHRFSEIINALDSSSESDVAVFVLKYADAKAVAAELKEVFQSPDSSVARSDARSRRGGFSSFFGGGGAPSDTGGSGAESKNAANKAVFTSDDQMNAVIASAPSGFFPMITNIIDRLDKPSQDVTEMAVFQLKYADPQEMADELANLFPDDTKTTTDQSSSRSMGFRFTPPWMQPQSSSSSSKSERMTRQTTVRAVPDPRTASLIITTSKDLMDQISNVIQVLDKNPAMAQHVHTFVLNNADPVTVQAALTAMFAGANTKTPTSTTPSALTQRETTAAQQQSTTTTGFGTTGSGTQGIH